MSAKERVYLLCDYTDARAAEIDVPLHIGVEHMGDCGGRIVRENGTEIGRHHSSSFGWLRADLRRKLDDPDRYEVVDLIGQPVPERFLRPETQIDRLAADHGLAFAQNPGGGRFYPPDKTDPGVQVHLHDAAADLATLRAWLVETGRIPDAG